MVLFVPVLMAMALPLLSALVAMALLCLPVLTTMAHLCISGLIATAQVVAAPFVGIILWLTIRLSHKFLLLCLRISMDTTTFAATSVVGIIHWLIIRLAQKAFRNLPPGPKGLPILGDLRHIADREWLASPRRRDEYGEHSSIRSRTNASRNLLIFHAGDMMYIRALGQGILVINSQRVAIDLLEKRSNIYSDRQHNISDGDFSTKSLILPLMPYGDLYAIDILSFHMH